VESVAGFDEEKAQPCAYATRSRGDFRSPLLWTVSLSELNLAAELFSALTLQRLEQTRSHDGFLSWKRNASDTTFMSRQGDATAPEWGRAFAPVEWRNG